MTKEDYLNMLPVPDVAMQVAGVYLETVITGYRTLSVEGREMVEAEIKTHDRYRGGEKFLRGRQKSRTLKVGFVLKAESAPALTEAIDMLAAQLRGPQIEETQFSFADEDDRYYIGTVKSLSVKIAGKNAAKGEIEIFCADPLKYAKTEKTVAASNGQISVSYDGTAPACPVLEAVAASDLGYVAFADASGHVIQIGDPDEADSTQQTMSETLIDDDFRLSMPTGWSPNTAYTPQDRNSHSHEGELKAGPDAGAGLSTIGGSYGPTSTGWHGPTLTKLIPADSGGHTGATNFSVDFFHLLTTATINDLGTFWVSVEAGSGSSRENIASIVFVKSAKGNNTSRAELCIMDEIMKTVNFDSSYNNPVTGYPPSWNGYENAPAKQTNPGAGRSSIQKFGSTIRFSLAGTIYEFEVPDVEDLEAKEVSVWFEQNGTDSPIGANVLRTLTFKSHSVETWEDVPNKFKDGDVITADTGEAVVRVNGVTEHGLGALGNDWEDFQLMPGSNTISCMYSDFADPPAFSLRYREAYR